ISLQRPGANSNIDLVIFRERLKSPDVDNDLREIKIAAELIAGTFNACENIPANRPSTVPFERTQAGSPQNTVHRPFCYCGVITKAMARPEQRPVCFLRQRRVIVDKVLHSEL